MLPPHGVWITEANEATVENHIIDWEGAAIIDKKPTRRTRQIREATWIRKKKIPLNRDDRNYELPHVYDDVIRH